MSALAVEISGLNKWFGPHHVLRDVSLGLGAGEKLVLCGPSGSGKSTLIRCINGLETFQEGALSLCGRSLDGSAAALREIRAMSGMVFQSFNLFPHLTVLENLCIGPVHGRGMARAEAVARARDLLERVRLSDQIAKYPGQLSGGQAQRVAIARTLMLEPRVLLFDEPTSALDPEMIHEVLEVMEELAIGGQSMIVVTHEMGFARRVADLVVFMDAGEIIEATDPESFFRAPRTPRAAEFVRQISHGG
ncbi:amino acid ABC transporter ATP-binding protein (plasmid) [Paroceanicella profunda]|uniref:Amino acid ABC transporter ATP-binding protein n=1 Tax=Paroceanicella profunda TaxID=2579971 RepID=A0A5B8G5Z0_9RHOB|nr:amino acid ABC transporter ATP-binding protein [Paroceanicella profunda]QDL94473.1 amino acid ABC transporter ATP-binding protein [Paroceanicella profunda]